eukprot:SAG11_NODE_24993_length_365_cov_0.586466_1_plen_52_part_01
MHNALVVMAVVVELVANLVAVLGTLKHTPQEVSTVHPEGRDYGCTLARKDQT